MDPGPNIKKMDTVVKIDAVSRYAMLWEYAMLLWFRILLCLVCFCSNCGSVCFSVLRLVHQQSYDVYASMLL